MEGFFPNQRYTSKGEPELGVGILIETGNRNIRIHFPKSNVCIGKCSPEPGCF